MIINSYKIHVKDILIIYEIKVKEIIKLLNLNFIFSGFILKFGTRNINQFKRKYYFIVVVDKFNL